MPRIVVSEPARLDLREHFGHLAESDYDKALDFFDAAHQIFAALARIPGMGSAYPSSSQLPILTQLVEPSIQCSFFQIGALCLRVSIAY